MDKSIVPVDLPNIFLGEIAASQREPDGLLHCSSDITNPIRFTQLEQAGAPKIERPIAQSIRLFHGTMWHNWFHTVLERLGLEFRYEVKLDEYLPPGWSGTADWVFYHPTYEAWVLADLKTTRGEGMHWIKTEGAKDTHIWQLSAYWHALERIGIPLIKGFAIMYWPMNDTADTVDITPVVHEVQPLEREEVLGRMAKVKDAVDLYLQHVEYTGEFVNAALAPMPDREQKYYWNKTQNAWDIKLVPHWMERYCDFDEDLCPRSGTTKIGSMGINGVYVPRSGYENIALEITIPASEFNKRRKV